MFFIIFMGSMVLLSVCKPFQEHTNLADLKMLSICAYVSWTTERRQKGKEKKWYRQKARDCYLSALKKNLACWVSVGTQCFCVARLVLANTSVLQAGELNALAPSSLAFPLTLILPYYLPGSPCCFNICHYLPGFYDRASSAFICPLFVWLACLTLLYNSVFVWWEKWEWFQVWSLLYLRLFFSSVPKLSIGECARSFPDKLV